MSARARSTSFEDVELRHTIEALHHARPRNRLVFWSCVVLALLAVYAWVSGDITLDGFFTERRAQNLERFLTQDLPPYALRGREFSWSELGAWAWKVIGEPTPDGSRPRGLAGAAATLSISVLAIVLSALTAWTLLFFAARNLATPDPFELRPRARTRGWIVLTGAVRAFLIFLRAIPEYIWAFLFLAMLGPSAWPAVLALALHNAGILGKLGAETVENLEPSAPRALRGLGATRAQLVSAAIVPAFLSRFLLYFFYRFETCVREATVLGMLGVVSLGYWIEDARTKQFYDEMVLLVAVGALLVLAADLLSALARALVRRAR